MWLLLNSAPGVDAVLSLMNYPCAGASPYETLKVADAGDVYLTMYDVERSAKDITSRFSELLSSGCKALAIGGDHTITYPILMAVKVHDLSLQFHDVIVF